MRKKGLAVIYNPHNLYEFVWYYSNNEHNEKEWDALCLPNGYKGEYMHEYCERAGIFSEVFQCKTDYAALPFTAKIKMLAGMFISFAVGLRTAYCRRTLNRLVPLDDYDEIVVSCGVGTVSGACIALGKEKKIVIMEDGINDYGKHPRLIPLKKILSFYNWQGFVLSAMGYSNPGWYRLNTTRNCIKYASQPEKMTYRNYLELRQLFAEEGTDTALFDDLVRRLYPGLNDYDLTNIDAVVLTRPLEDFVGRADKYIHRFEQYIRERYRSILLKKHPREQTVYDFGDEVTVLEIDNSIPAEALLSRLKGKEIIIVTTSAIMLYMKAHSLQCRMTLFDGMYEESIRANTQFRAMGLEEARAFAEQYCAGNYTVDII